MTLSSNQVSKMTFLLLRGFTGIELLPASQLKGRQWQRENLNRHISSNAMIHICSLIPPEVSVHLREPNFCFRGTKGFSKKKSCGTTWGMLAQLFM